MNSKLIILIMIGVIFIPIVTNYLLMSWNMPGVIGDSHTWLSFLGNYSGGVIGSLLTLLGVKWTIEKMEDERLYREKKKHSVELPQQIIDVGSIVTLLDQFYYNFEVFNSNQAFNKRNEIRIKL
jgi:hypothetical protein